MKSNLHPTITKLALLAGSFCAMAHAATIFNFDNDTFGTMTTFTDTVNGLSATFSSPPSPGAFSIQQSFFDTLTGNVLITPNTVPLDRQFQFRPVRHHAVGSLQPRISEYPLAVDIDGLRR